MKEKRWKRMRFEMKWRNKVEFEFSEEWENES
jgi:hypothetical protein